MTHQRDSQAIPVTHGRAHDSLVYPHPAREDSGGSQTRAHTPVGHHEHLGGARVLGEICPLDAHGGEDHDAEEDAQTDEHAVGRALRDELQTLYNRHYDGYQGLLVVPVSTRMEVTGYT